MHLRIVEQSIGSTRLEQSARYSGGILLKLTCPKYSLISPGTVPLASPELVGGLTWVEDVHSIPLSPRTLDGLPILEDTDAGRGPNWEAESLGRSIEDEDENGRACWG